MPDAPLPLSPPPAGASTHLWRWAFRDLAHAHPFRPLRVEGALPPGLVGTLYRVGPALFAAQGRPYHHWFDGDGAVSAVRFAGGRAEGAVRLVETEGLLAERRAGRALFGGFGTRPPGGPLQRLWATQRGMAVKNTANTNLAWWSGQLLALWEGGLPTRLSPEDLATLGTTDLGGVVVQAFSAHPHRVPERRCTYGFGLRLGRRAQLDVYALPDEGPARRLTTVPLSGTTLLHDCVATGRHLVFFAPPVRLSLPRLLLGQTCFAETLRWQPQEGTEVVVVPLDAPHAPVRFTAEPFFQWHFANAFERAPGELVVDFVRLPDFESNGWLGAAPRAVPPTPWAGRLGRAVVDLARRTLRWEARWEVPCEFPCVPPLEQGRAHRSAFVACASSPEAARGQFDALGRVDVETGQAEVVRLGEAQYPSEPVLVRRPDGEGAGTGWLLTLVYDGHADASHVAVLDADALERGPVARVHFDHPVPFTFHGIFVDAGPA